MTGGFARYWLPVIAYVAMIFSLSSIHGSSVPNFFPGVDKLEHLLEYSLFGLLAGRAIRFTLGPTHRRLRAAFGTMALGALVAALDEVYQLRVPGRSSDVRDWITDVAAVAISVLVTQLIHTRPIIRRASNKKVEKTTP
ncbi:MAG TPA: VanZ family protein [Candidatus Eisenbacteria bacterium]|nr:VanZ family protein [Candidatus Eisenbacteria bacterium]